MAYVKYDMFGFNKKYKSKVEIDGRQKLYQVELLNNDGYKYQSHSFLDGFKINDDITEITFDIKNGIVVTEQILEDIGLELEKICFNLITYSDLDIEIPCCRIKSCKFDNNENECELHLNETAFMRDEASIYKTLDSKSNIYDVVTENSNNIENKYPIYKEIFWLLNCPSRLVQFMGLYDIMSGLIHDITNNRYASQKEVYDYFEQ